MIAGVAAGDPDATRTVYAVVIGLAVVGLALLVVAIWLVRQTKVDPELLAPLERMDDRRWMSRDPATQRRMLDEVRPDGAEPLHRERPVPAVDEEFEAELHPVAGFDDLKDVEIVLKDVELAAEESGADAPGAGSEDDDEAAEPGADDASDPGSVGDQVDEGSDAAAGADDEAVSESEAEPESEEAAVSEPDASETTGEEDAEVAEADDVAAGADDSDERRSAVSSAHD